MPLTQTIDFRCILKESCIKDIKRSEISFKNCLKKDSLVAKPMIDSTVEKVAVHLDLGPGSD